MKKREEKKNNDWIPVFTGMTREESEVGFFSSVIPVKTGIQKKDWIPAFPPSPKAMERQSAGMTERMRGSRIIEMINKTSRKILAGVLCALKRTSFALFIFAIISVSCFGGLGKLGQNIFSAKIANADFNKEINYQGKLTDSSGTAVSNGNYNIQFNLYTASSGGSPIWTENQCYSPDGGTTCDGTGTDSRVTFTGGLFSAMLGNISSLASVDFNQTLYLGVKIGGSGATPTWDTEMTPRKILGAVPASFESDKLDGLDSTSFLRSDAVNSGAIFTNSTTTNATTTNISTGSLTVTGTATSTFGGAINLTGGCFAINGVCSSGLGTVTSVGMTTPTGLSVSGSPITGAGTLALSFASGYSIPLTASTTEGTTAYTRSVSSWTTPLQFSNGVASILQSGSATNGYLSSGDWNIFNNKISSSSLSAVYPLSYNSSTGIFTSALTTTTANTWSGLQTFSNTGTTTFAGGVEVSGHFTSGANKALVVNSTATANSLVVASNGNVGVGTASPTVVLDVAGDINVSSTKAYRIGGFATLTQSGLITRFGNSLGAGSAYQLAFYSGTGSEAMRIDSTSNVGIGTTTPGSRLSIQGIANFSLATSTVYSGIFTSGLHATSSGLTISGGNILLTSGATSTFNNGIDISSGCFSINGTCISGGAGGGGTVTSVATNNGLTGGTITGSGTIGLNITGLSANDLVTWNGTNLVATGTPQLTIGNLVATSTTATSTLLGGFTAGNNSAFVVNQTATANALTIAGNGNVGVGTTGPSDLLNVYGDNKYFALQRSVNSADMGVRFKTGLTNDWFFGLRDTVDSDFHMYNYGTNSDALTILKANGNIGIGTAVPSTALEIRHTDATTNSNTSFWDYTFGGGLILSNITNTANALTGIGLYGGVNSNSAAGLAMVQETANSLGGLAFYTGGSGRNNTVPERFRIDSGGNVGIGTTSPAKLLSVQGDGLFAGDLSLANLTATGTITSTGTGTSTFAGGLAVSGHFTSGANSALVVNSGATANSLVVTSNGRVGIGTSDPGAYSLKIASGDMNIGGSVVVGSSLKVNNVYGGQNSGNSLTLQASVNNPQTGYVLLAPTAGNVGIGTTTPAKLLSVQGDGLFAGDLSVAGLTATGTVAFTGTGTSTFAGGLAVTGHLTSGVNKALVVNSGAIANSLVVTSNGNIGIGVANPSKLLEVVSGATTAMSLNSSGLLNINSALQINGSTAFSVSGTQLRIGTSYTSQYLPGLVGIGTTTPAKLLSVQGDGLFAGDISVAGLTATGTISSASTATSTFSGGISTAGLSSSVGLTITGGGILSTGTATSSLAGGIDISGGCFAINGVCVGGATGGGGSGTVSSGTLNRLSYYSGATTLSSADFLTVDATNFRFGIGTSTPSSKFSITANSSQSIAGLYIEGVPSNLGALFSISTSTASATSTAFVIDSNGKVGIGTSTPSQQLNIAGNLMLENQGGIYFGSQSGASYGSVGLFASSTMASANYNLYWPSTISATSGQAFLVNNLGYMETSDNFDPMSTTTWNNDQEVRGDFVSSSAYLGALTFASDAGLISGMDLPISSQAGLAGLPMGYSLSIGGNASSSLSIYGEHTGDSGGIRNFGVAIGTSTPTSDFTIWGSGTGADRFFELVNDASTTLMSMLENGTGYFGGSIGIGTTTPAKLLSVQGDGLFAGNLSLANLTATGTVTSTGTGTSTFAGGLAVTGHFTSGANSALVVNSGATANSLVVASNGNVGVGTASPLAALDIRQNTINKGIIVRPADGGSEYFELYVTNSGAGTFYSNDNLMFSSDLDTYFRAATGRTIKFADTTNANVTMVTGGGNVGIGTTSPYAKLSLVGNQAIYNRVTSNIGLDIFGIDGQTADLFRVSSTSATYATSTAFVIDANGKVGIGTTTPYTQLSVQGGIAGDFLNLSSTATSTFAGGVDIGAGSFSYDYESGITSIASLETGNLNFDVDAGAISWVDLPLSGALAGTLESYTASIADLPAITVYGLANGSGGIYTGPFVGIGTSTPSSVLSVWGLGNGTNRMFELVNSASTTLMSMLENGTGYFGGSIGIGTTSPAKLLSVQGDGLFAGDISLANLTATGTATLGNISSGGGSTLFGINAGLTISHGPNLQTMTYGATGLNVASEVGYGNPFSSQAGGSTAWGGIFLNTSGLSPTVYLAGGASNPYSAIFLNGNVGIGTTTPGYKLVTSNATVNTFMMEESGGGTQTPPTTYALQGSGAAFSTFASDATNGYRRFLDIISDGTAGSAGSEMRFFTGPGGAVSERMRLDYNGNVGIGTTSPSTLLHLGTAGVADSNLLTLEDSNGICTMNPGSGAAWSCSSDRELKHDIADLSSVGLDTINRLRPTTFKMNAGNSERVGFIAQEVKEILPSLVSVLPDGHLGVSDGGMMPYVVKAIQEGYTKLLELEQKTASTTDLLSERISELELRIGTTTTASVIDGVSSSGSSSLPSVDSILTSLEILGTKIVDGLISVRDLVAEVITVKKLTVKSDNLASTGVTIYDRGTGLPVCMYVANGVVSTEAGECGSVVADTSSSSSSPADNSTATTTPSLPAPEIITPPTDSGTSTSTEPVIISEPVLTDISTTTPSDVPDTVVVPADESSEALATTTPAA